MFSVLYIHFILRLLSLCFLLFPPQFLVLTVFCPVQVIALDVNLPVKQAFHILYEQVLKNHCD